MWYSTRTGKTLALGWVLLCPLTYLINKGLVKEVWSTNAQIKNINSLQNSIIESIQEP